MCLLLAQSGFVFMNALAFWFEVLGSLLGLLFGRPIPLFVFEILYAYAVGYVLYWLVTEAVGRDYKLYAAMLYTIYSLINVVQAVSAMALILPPVFYFLKTLASLSCGYYAFKIREETPPDAIQLKDEVDLEGRVAE
jgi:hypothetical protein